MSLGLVIAALLYLSLMLGELLALPSGSGAKPCWRPAMRVRERDGRRARGSEIGGEHDRVGAPAEPAREREGRAYERGDRGR